MAFSAVVAVFILHIGDPGTSLAGIPVLFEHPRDGQFKILSPALDTWRNDKAEHCLANYLAVRALKTAGRLSPRSAVALAVLNIVKELEDAFREGFSWIDLAAGGIGGAAGWLGLYVKGDLQTLKIVYIITW